jgi:hypothetical protein
MPSQTERKWTNSPHLTWQFGTQTDLSLPSPPDDGEVHTGRIAVVIRVPCTPYARGEKL